MKNNTMKKTFRPMRALPVLVVGCFLVSPFGLEAATPATAGAKKVTRKLIMDGIEESAERAAREAAAARAARSAANSSRAWDLGDKAVENGGKILFGGTAGTAVIIGTHNMTSKHADGSSVIGDILKENKVLFLVGLALGAMMAVVCLKPAVVKELLRRQRRAQVVSS